MAEAVVGLGDCVSDCVFVVYLKKEKGFSCCYGVYVMVIAA